MPSTVATITASEVVAGSATIWLLRSTTSPTTASFRRGSVTFARRRIRPDSSARITASSPSFTGFFHFVGFDRSKGGTYGSAFDAPVRGSIR